MKKYKKYILPIIKSIFFHFHHHIQPKYHLKSTAVAHVIHLKFLSSLISMSLSFISSLIFYPTFLS